MFVKDNRMVWEDNRKRPKRGEIKAVSLKEAGNMVSPVSETECLVFQKAPLRSSQWAGRVFT